MAAGPVLAPFPPPSQSPSPSPSPHSMAEAAIAAAVAESREDGTTAGGSNGPSPEGGGDDGGGGGGGGGEGGKTIDRPFSPWKRRRGGTIGSAADLSLGEVWARAGRGGGKGTALAEAALAETEAILLAELDPLVAAGVQVFHDRESISRELEGARELAEARGREVCRLRTSEGESRQVVAVSPAQYYI